MYNVGRSIGSFNSCLCHAISEKTSVLKLKLKFERVVIFIIETKKCIVKIKVFAK